MVLFEEDLTDDTLYEAVRELYDNRNAFIERMSSSTQSNAIPVIMDLIKEYAK